MRAFVHQLLGQGQNVVVLLAAHQIAEMFHPGRGIHFFGDDQRLGIKIERNRSVSAGRSRRGLDLAPGRLQRWRRHPTTAFRCSGVVPQHPPTMRTPYSVNETLVILGQLGRAELVDRASAFVLRQAGVGQNRDELGRIEPEEAHRIVHLLRAGGAVEADDVDVERFERGERRADFGAEQHSARGFKRDLHRHRQTLARSSAWRRRCRPARLWPEEDPDRFRRAERQRRLRSAQQPVLCNRPPCCRT